MNLEAYRSLLGQLPIINPSLQDMANLCPHLTQEEVAEAFNGSRHIACPPICVKNVFQVIYYHPEWVEEIKKWRVIDGVAKFVVIDWKNHPAILDSSIVVHSTELDADSHRYTPRPYPYMEKAMRFAEDNWGDKLVADDWVSIMRIFVQDPTDLINDRYHSDHPRTKAVLYIALNREIVEILKDSSKPKSELLDEAISRITLDPFIWREMQGGRSISTGFNCANCGAGLSLTSCPQCGHHFQDRGQFRHTWKIPLSAKMLELLDRNGYEFKCDPERAQAKETREWAIQK